MRKTEGVRAWRRLLVAVAIASPGCGLTLRSDIHDPDPASKIPALVDAGDQPTADELVALVEALDHDDAAVRLFAIESLKRATGETRGFRPYDPAEERDAAYRRWRDWLAGMDGGGTAAGEPVRTAGREAGELEEQAHGGGR